MNRHPELRTDVCVVGGGPAGSVFAMHLGRLGHQVVLIEEARFPRRHVGEAITPGIWPLLERLGLSSAVAARGVSLRSDTVVGWRGDAEANAPASHVTVDRGAFDAILLDGARRSGARVLSPARAYRSRSADDTVIVRTAAEETVIKARVIADATGRRGWLPGVKQIVSAPTVAVYAYWRTADGNLSTETRVVAGRDEWYWGAPMPDGTFNAMVFTDPDKVRRSGAVATQTLARRYRILVEQSGILSSLGTPEMITDPVVCDATARIDHDPIGAAWIKLGDASLALDPLSATGVERAVRTALSGGAVVHTMLARPDLADAAQEFYISEQRAASASHARWASQCYADRQLFSDSAFWQRRAVGAEFRPNRATGRTPEELLNAAVCLSDSARLITAPCLVGELIQHRPAIAHPNLDRPVAFFGDVAIEPFVQQVRAGLTVRELVAEWNHLGPFKTRVSVAAWLFANGIIVPDPSCGSFEGA